MTPTWESDDGRVRLWLGDCLDVLGSIEADAVVTDPPYGISYASGMTGHDGGTALPGIIGDEDTSLRDAVIEWAGSDPVVCFGTWKRARPQACRAVLIWDKGDHVGMGDLSVPWKPNTEEIYVMGRGFGGHRGSSVLRHNAPVTWNSVGIGRLHPHEKPVPLIIELVGKVEAETILDPFMGSGTTGIACIRTGRRFLGIEKDEKYFMIAKKRIQEELARTPLFDDAVPLVQQPDLFESDG